MQDITISDEYIRLGQALKLSGFAESGVDAKVRIENGDVTVNGEVETRRGKKLRDGDVVAMDGNSFTVHSKLADKA
jgi:ribosome-associated protein